jgi:hypothetical protein
MSLKRESIILLNAETAAPYKNLAIHETIKNIPLF